MRLPPRSLLAWSLILATAPASAAPPAPPPPARTVDVVETRFGVAVADPYRWMEGAENPERDTWLRTQGAYTRAWLDAVPGRARLHDRLRELGLGTGAIGGLQLAGGRQFFLWTAPGAQLPVLKVRDGKGERVLVDPAALAQDDRHAALHAFAPSPDGTLLAYDLSLGGSEVSTLHVLDVATGKDLPDQIERVWGEFTANWLPDGTAFTYTQMSPDALAKDPMVDMRARLHVMGTPVERDVTLLDRARAGGLALAPEEFPMVLATPGSGWLIAYLGGARAETRVAVAPLSKLDRSGAGRTPWREVARYQDEVAGALVHGDRLYLDSFHGTSNHRVLSVLLSAPDLARARTELPERPDAVLDGIQGAKDGLYARYRIEGKASLQAATTSGRPILVRLEEDGGHGMGSTRDQRFAEQADVYAFFLATAGEAGFVAPW
jgi:prolyl oligopeptidase